MAPGGAVATGEQEHSPMRCDDDLALRAISASDAGST
jgi:hypothetical protein